MICRHCNRSKVSRGRGLCRVCFYTPGVKQQYAPIGPCGRRSEVPCVSQGNLPDLPVTARPGSQKKIAVLEARALRGETLWHPLDQAS